MDHEEEQLLELEALESIFLSDYALVRDAPPRVVELRLFPIPGEDADEENKVGMLGRFTLPASYPEAAPEVALEPLRGLTSKHCETVLELLAQTAEASLGMPMIYTLAEAAKDWLAENNRDHTDESMHAQMMAKLEKAKADQQRQDQREEGGEAESAEEEAERRRRQTADGTAVTKESFLAWERAFIDEMRAQSAAEDPTSAVAHQQQRPTATKADAELTGRQYFEQQALRAAAGGAPLDEGDEEGEEGEWERDIQEELFLEGADDDELDALPSSDGEDDDEDDDDDDEEDE